MSSTDIVTSRAQSRPYYDAETFNIGYVAKFSPDKGVLDQNGFSIASKLSIIDQKRSRLSHSLMGNAGALDKIIPLSGFGSTTPLRFPGLAISWNDLFDFNKWENLIWKVLLRQYCKNLLQQPFETCKIIMQTTSIHDDKTKVASEIEKKSKEEENDEIDFFPLYKDEDNLHSLNTIDKQVAMTDFSQNENQLQITKLTTWSIINAMRNDDNFGIASLWRSNNITFLYNFLKKSINLFTSHVVSPFYYYYNLSFSTILGLKVVTNFLTEIVLLPLDLYKMKLLVSNKNTDEIMLDEDDNSISSKASKFGLYNWWSFELDNKVIRLFGLILLKIACKKFFDNGLEFMIYYWLNFTNVQNKIYLIFLLKFTTEFCEFFIKLPIETLIRRYQVDYLLTNKNDKQIKLNASDLVIKPVNINTSQIWHGLWNGWKIGLMSLLCGFGFKLMNNIDDDLEQERF